jgi:hypothetical protein
MGGMAMALFAAFMLVATWRLGLTYEAAQMQYIASLILEGSAPYRGIFDINMPVTYWFHMFEITAFGKSDLAWRVFDYVTLAISCSFLYFSFEPNRRKAVILCLSLFVIFHVLGSASALGQRDYFMLVLLSAFNFLYVKSLRDETAYAQSYIGLAGFCLGLATFVKPTAIVLFPAFALHRLCLVRGTREGFLCVLFFALGGLAALVCVCSWLLSKGSLGAFFDIQLNFVLPIYSKFRYPFSWQGNRIALGIVAVGFLAAIYCLSCPQNRRKPTSGAAFLASSEFIVLIMLCFGIFSYLVQWKFAAYQLVPAIAYSLLTVAAAYNLSRWSPARGFRIAGLSMLVCATIVTLGQFYSARLVLGELFTFKRSEITATLIEDLQKPEFSNIDMQPLDDTSGINEAFYRTDRQLPTRYLTGFQFFLNVSSPYIDALRTEFLARLAQAGYPPIIISKLQFPHASTYDTIGEWPDFVDFLKRHYRLAIERNFQDTDKGYRIYVSRH